MKQRCLVGAAILQQSTMHTALLERVPKHISAQGAHKHLVCRYSGVQTWNMSSAPTTSGSAVVHAPVTSATASMRTSGSYFGSRPSAWRRQRHQSLCCSYVLSPSATLCPCPRTV